MKLLSTDQPWPEEMINDMVFDDWERREPIKNKYADKSQPGYYKALRKGFGRELYLVKVLVGLDVDSKEVNYK